MRYCLICMNEINRKGFFQIFFKPLICHNCFIELKRKPCVRIVNGIKVYSLFPYQDKIKSLIYQYKGCYDIALASVFLSYDWLLLKIRFFNYYIVPVPSFLEHDKKRGFNHVEEMFKCLNLPILKILYKNKDYKQSSLSYEERQKYVENIIIDKDIVLLNKRILLVDDIITSGSTINKCVELLMEKTPIDLKTMTIAHSLSKKYDI